MNKINILNKIKFIFAVVIFSLMAVSSQTKTYPHIPLKGLFEVLKHDDICFGHALLHSKWIENMFQYGSGKPHRQENYWRPTQKDDAVANLIRKFGLEEVKLTNYCQLNLVHLSILQMISWDVFLGDL